MCLRDTVNMYPVTPPPPAARRPSCRAHGPRAPVQARHDLCVGKGDRGCWGRIERDHGAAQHHVECGAVAVVGDEHREKRTLNR